jgi:putative ABC transport system substrate-binding protein
LVRNGAKGLVLGVEQFFTSRTVQLVGLADRYAIPTIYALRAFVEAGGLVSYGPDLAYGDRQLGVYAGKILAGANPGDLPVMQTHKFELVINLKTANALGLTIPLTILGGADEVIE